MKKYLCIILACLLSIVLIGCDNNAGAVYVLVLSSVLVKRVFRRGETKR